MSDTSIRIPPFARVEQVLTVHTPGEPAVPIAPTALRDYFAAATIAHAFVGTRVPMSQELVETITTDAYRIADSMLTARERKPERQS